MNLIIWNELLLHPKVLKNNAKKCQQKDFKQSPYMDMFQSLDDVIL